MIRSFKIEVLRIRFWNLSNSRNVLAHAKFNCDDDIMMFGMLEMSFSGIAFDLHSSYLNYSLFLFKTDNNFSHFLLRIWHLVIFRLYCLSYIEQSWSISHFFHNILRTGFTLSRIKLHCLSYSFSIIAILKCVLKHMSVKWKTTQVDIACSILRNYIRI